MSIIAHSAEKKKYLLRKNYKTVTAAISQQRKLDKLQHCNGSKIFGY
jgi:hypothetical protein